jgi:hypothetical protein
MISSARSRSLNVKKTGERPVPDEMAGDAKDLRQHDPDDLRARRYVDASELFDRQAVGEIVHHAAEIVDAIGVGKEGVPRLPFRHLFGAAVVEADVGYRVDDAFSVELKNDAQDAVSAGVLWADV